MPTDEVIDDVNASGQTDEESPPATAGLTDEEIAALPEDKIKSHPFVQKLQEKHSAARKGMDQANKKAKAAAKETDEESVAEVAEEEIDWKIEHADRVKLCKPEFQAYLSKGIPRDEALRLAEMDKGLTKVSDSSESNRQAATSSPSGTLNRATKAPVTLTEHDARFGLTAERKRELEEKYPDLKESV